jgi:hypothetical protein
VAVDYHKFLKDKKKVLKKTEIKLGTALKIEFLFEFLIFFNKNDVKIQKLSVVMFSNLIY